LIIVIVIVIVNRLNTCENRESLTTKTFNIFIEPDNKLIFLEYIGKDLDKKKSKRNKLGTYENFLRLENMGKGKGNQSSDIKIEN